MRPVPASSGDLIADRRYEWARGAMEQGDLVAAEDLLAQAVELAPLYAAAWFALGEVRDRSGNRDGAVMAFEKARAADPNDRHGASLQLIRLGVQPRGEAPAAYVRAVFDQYAPVFDTALRDGLKYRAPELLLRAVEKTDHLKFGAALDLGCGTGLGGAAFRPYVRTLTGVDLSGGMLAQARTKNIYDALTENDVLQFLRDDAVRGAQYDLVIAADVVMYFADLAALLRAVAPVMAPGATLAFTTETHDDKDVVLRDTLRYAHSADAVTAALRAAGLTLLSLDRASTRNEKGVPVPGLVAVARK